MQTCAELGLVFDPSKTAAARAMVQKIIARRPSQVVELSCETCGEPLLRLGGVLICKNCGGDRE
jgi:hypothetical protein